MKTRTKGLRFSVIFFFALISGVAITFLSQKLELLVFLLLVVAVPIGLYALPAVLFVFPKIRIFLHKLHWWHILWFMAFLSGLTFKIHETTSIRENPFDLAIFFRVTLVGIIGVVLLGFFTLKKRAAISNLFKGLVGLLSGYALVCVFSTLWSVYPALTLYKSVEYLIMVTLMAATIGHIRVIQDFKTLFDWNWLLVGMVLTSVWIGAFFRPSEAFIRGIGLIGIQIQGVFPRVAANGVGELGALLGVISLVRLLYARGRSRRFYLVIFGISMVTLVLSQSRSPLTGFLLAVLLILFLDKRISLLALGMLSFPLLVSLTPLGNIFWQFFLRGQSEALFFSLSGRAYYWQAALNVIKENPIFGFGAYAAGRFLVAKEFSPTLSSLHGTWPEVLVGTGVLGLVPLILAVLGTWKVLLVTQKRRTSLEDRLRHQLRLEAVGVMTLLSVRSIFTVSFIWHPALTWLLVLGYAEFLRRGGAYSTCSQHLPPAWR